MKKIHFFRSQPEKVIVAFSGGMDSMVLTDLLITRNRKPTLLVVDHLDDYAKEEVSFATHVAKKHRLTLLVKKIKPKTEKLSKEAYWSRERDDIFQLQSLPVLTGHHLEDAVEWYVMSSMQGASKLLNYNNRNVYRPLLITPKHQIIEYANHRQLTYLTDPTNADSGFNLRNKVRHELLGSNRNVFPGVSSTVRRLIVKKESKD